MAPIAAKNNINRGSANINAKDKLHQVQQSNLDITYMLYLHREELRKKKPSFISKVYTKLQLTRQLITKTVQKADKCSSEDLHNIGRETVFKNKLKRQIARFKHYRAEKDQKKLRQQRKIQKFKQQLPQEQPQSQQISSPQHKQADNKAVSAQVNKIKRKLF